MSLHEAQRMLKRLHRVHPVTPATIPPVHRPAGACTALLNELRTLGASSLAVTSSVSLQHLPWDVTLEPALPAGLAPRLAFAVQKLGAIARLAAGKGVSGAAGAAGGWVGRVRDSAMELERAMFDRAENFEARRAKQPQFPAFPTTSSESAAGSGGGVSRFAFIPTWYDLLQSFLP
jgi:hypothetical protein